MSDRKILFLGDCQAMGLMQIYRDFIAPVTGDTVRWVSAATRATQADLRHINEADVVVSQVFNVERATTADGMRPDALKVEFPALFVGFLWPFSGQAAHVRNLKTAFIPVGPYDAQVGDTFLNKLIQEGVAPDEALRRYREVDMARVARLDRLAELQLGAQAARDERTNFSFARRIEAQFRNTPLFLTSSHPDLALMVTLTRGVFERLGVPEDLLDRAIQAQRVPPFPPTALPLHPSVIRHFDLQFADEHSRYPFKNEGSFTFDEFVIRYMTYTWNEPLIEGLVIAQGADALRAHALLEPALQISPDSVAGWRAISSVLRRMRRLTEAHAAAQRAIALAPENPDCHVELANVLLDARDIPGAEAEAREAIAAFPTEGRSHFTLAKILLEANRIDEAAAAAERAVILRPADRASRALLGQILGHENRGCWPGAEIQQSTSPGILATRVGFVLAQDLFRTGKYAESLAATRELLLADGQNPHVHALLGHLLAHNNDPAGAEAAFRKASELDPASVGFRISLVHTLLRQEKYGDAVKIVRELLVSRSNDPSLYNLLGRILVRQTDLAGAQLAFRSALALNPASPGSGIG